MKSSLVLNPTLEVNVLVNARVRNAVRSPWAISGVDKPVLMRLIADLLSGGDPRKVLAGAPANTFEHLKELGVIVERGEEPALPVFEHALDEDVLRDVAPSARSHAPDLDPSTLVFSPSYHILSGEKGRAAARAIPFLYPISGRRSSAWVQDSGTGARLVYGLSREWTKCLLELRKSRLSARVLDPQRRAVLVHAGLLVPQGHSMARKVEIERAVREARASIRRDGHAILRSVLPPYFMALLRRHYRRLRMEGFFAYDREQVKRMRCYMHNEPVTRFVHWQLGPMFGRATGEAIIPSYSIVTEYFAGARLPKHTDREQCEWNITLLADPLPVFEGRDSWPIYLEVKGRPLAVRLNIGDALVYQGIRTPHWRNRLEKGRTCKIVLFHFVHRGFGGPLD